MDMHKIEVFIAVAQHRSFTAAAQHLHIAQSAVSHDIAELEKTLGTKLFDRSKKGTTLSSAGEVFLEDAYKIVSIVANTKHKIKNIESGDSGALEMGFVSQQMAEPIYPFLKSFYEEYGSIQLSFNAYSSPMLSHKMDSGEVDICLSRQEVFSNMNNMEWFMLYHDPFCIAFPKGHFLEKESKVTLDMIENEPIILMTRESNPGFYDITQKLFAAKGFTPRIAVASNDRMATLMMVRMGMGVTLFTKEFIKVYTFGNIATKLLHEEYAYHEIGAAWNTHNTNPAIGLFVERLKEYCARFPNGHIPIL